MVTLLVGIVYGILKGRILLMFAPFLSCLAYARYVRRDHSLADLLVIHVSCVQDGRNSNHSPVNKIGVRLPGWNVLMSVMLLVSWSGTIAYLVHTITVFPKEQTPSESSTFAVICC